MVPFLNKLEVSLQFYINKPHSTIGTSKHVFMLETNFMLKTNLKGLFCATKKFNANLKIPDKKY